jgi:hypothetical protein
MIPSLGPGISPSEARYMRDVNQPMYETAKDQQLYDHGARFGEQTSRMLTNIGVPDMLNMSADDFQRNLVNAGSSPVGRQVVGQVMANKTVQGIMGGDVIGASDQLLGSRHTLGVIPGELLDPEDIRGQAAMMQHASDVSSELMKSVYTQADGTQGITPNYDYTRGFTVDDMAKVGTHMAARGVRHMQGIDIDPREKAEGIGEMNRVMESLADLTGSDDISQLMANLDKISNKRWPAIMSMGGGGALEDSFRQMSAMSKALGVSGDVMVDTVINMQDTLKGSMGITQDHVDLGIDGGGYGGAGGQYMAERVLAISAANPDKSRQQVMAEQGALSAITMDSEKGRTMQLVNYLDQQNAISAPLYEALEEAVDLGDTQKQRSVTDEIFRKAYGSEFIGRELAQNDNYMSQVIQDTDDATAVRTMSQIMSMAGSELGERAVQHGFQGMKRGVSAYTKETGVPVNVSREDVAGRDMASITGYFEDHDDSETAQMFTELYDTEFAKTGDAQKAMNVVRGALTSDKFDMDRGSIMERIEQGRQQQVADIVAEGEYDEIGAANTLIHSLQGTKGLTGEQSSEFRGKMRDITKELEKTGDTEKADAAATQVQADIEKLVGKDSLKYKLAQEDVDISRERAEEAKEITAATNTYVDRQLNANASGVGVGAVRDEQTDLADIYADLESGDMSKKEALGIVSDFASLGGEDYKDVVSTIKKGVTEDQVKQQRRVALTTDDSAKRAAAERLGGAAAGLAGATEDIVASRETFEDAESMAIVNAAKSKVIDDEHQDMRTTFSQLAVGAVSGDVTVARLLGMEDADPVTADMTRAERKKARAAAEATRKDKARIDAIGQTAEAVERREDVAGSRPAKRLRGLAEDAKKSTAKSRESAKAIRAHAMSDEVKEAGMSPAVFAYAAKVADPTLSKKGREEAQETMEKKLSAAGVSQDRIDDVTDDAKKHRKNVGKTVKIGKKMNEVMDSMSKDEDVQRVAVDEKARKRRVSRTAAKARDSMTSAEGTGKLEGTFLVDLEFDKLEGDERKEALKAAKTLSGRTDSNFWNAGIFSGNDVKEAEAEMAKFAGKSSQEIEKIIGEGGERSEAASKLAEIYKSQEADGDSKGGKPKRGDKDKSTMRLTGELVIKTPGGRVLGSAEANNMHGAVGG